MTKCKLKLIIAYSKAKDIFNKVLYLKANVLPSFYYWKFFTRLCGYVHSKPPKTINKLTLILFLNNKWDFLCEKKKIGGLCIRFKKIQLKLSVDG